MSQREECVQDVEPNPAKEPGDDAADASEVAKRSDEEWQSLVQELELKAEQNWDKAIRAMSELENTRRRAQRDVEQAHKFGVEKLVNALLPVIDSLEQAFGSVSPDADDQGVLAGVQLTHKMLMSALAKFQVEVCDPEGEKFDPELHEAMSVQEAASEAPGQVLTVLQKGYLLHGRVIRAARVIVSK